MDATKYVEPKSSVYIEHWKLWLRSKTLTGGGGGGLNMALGIRMHKKRAQLHQTAIFGSVQQPSTSISEPNQVFRTVIYCLYSTLKILVGIRNLDRRRWRRPQNGLRAQVHTSAKRLFWRPCSSHPHAYLNPTKCFEPTSSAYTRP